MRTGGLCALRQLMILKTRIDSGLQCCVFIHISLKLRLLKISKFKLLIEAKGSIDVGELLRINRGTETSDSGFFVGVFKRWNALVLFTASITSFLPPNSLFGSHLVLLRAKLFNLKCADEKNHCRIVKEEWAVSVVIALKLYYVFVSCVLLEHLF